LLKETQKETESRSAMKNFEDFVEKMKKTIPDPIVSFLITKPRMSVRHTSVSLR
jgi:p-aminobenzoyl-glutamate transporter AbgT